MRNTTKLTFELDELDEAILTRLGILKAHINQQMAKMDDLFCSVLVKLMQKKGLEKDKTLVYHKNELVWLKLIDEKAKEFENAQK